MKEKAKESDLDKLAQNDTNRRMEFRKVEERYQ